MVNLSNKSRFIFYSLCFSSLLGTKLMKLLEQESKKESVFKPLLICYDGGLISETVSSVMSQCHDDPTILLGGYQQYRNFVERNLLKNEDDICDLRVHKFRYIVVTGPSTGGRDQIVDVLETSGAQVLHLDHLAGDSPSQEMFESRLLHSLIWTWIPDTPVWVIFSGRVDDLCVPSNVEECLLQSARIHVDTDLDDRLEFIIKEFDYIVKDERSVAGAQEKILKYSGINNNDDQHWSEIIERFKKYLLIVPQI